MGGTQHQHVRTNHQHDHVGEYLPQFTTWMSLGARSTGVRCGQGPYVEAQRAEWALKAQLLAPPPPQAEWVPPYWSPCVPFPLANSTPKVRVSERGQLKVQQEGLGWSTKFLDEVSGEPRAHTAHTAPTRWEGQRPPQPQSGAGSLQYSHAHTDLVLCASSLGWGTGAHIGEGGSLGVRTQCEPPIWDSWLNMGGRRPQSSCKAGGGENSSRGGLD